MNQENFTGFEHSGTANAAYHGAILVPSLLTNSLRVVLNTFGEDIYRITAHGSTTTTNHTTAENLREYGVSIERCNSHAVNIDYERLITRDGEPKNSLTEDVVQELCSELDVHLEYEDLSVAPDLTVTSVTLRITDERLAEVTPAQTAEFDLQFIADPAEDTVSRLTERVNRGRGLYDELGFDRMNLNLHSVIETATQYQTRSDGQYFNWNGPDRPRSRTPDLLANRINQRVLPDECSMLKPYSVVDDRVLEIDDSDINDEFDSIEETEER